MDKNKEYKKVQCPYCGYKMPIYCNRDSESHGLWVVCKGRNCKRRFEIKISKVK